MPAEGVAPKAVQVSIQPWVWEMHTTAAGHWDGWRGMVQYASAMSHIATSDPGGRQKARRYTIKNLPHVAGKLCGLICELIEGEECRVVGL